MFGDTKSFNIVGMDQSQPVYDAVIVGGGVVGCAMQRRFTLEGAKTLLIERGRDILSGASKGNSAILHTGFDAEPDSIELACMRAGRAEYLAIHDKLGLPLHKTGAMVVAWTDEEHAKLDDILSIAHRNGAPDATRIEPPAIYAREPHLAPGARGAVLVPEEDLIDPWSAPLAYVLQALANGGEIRRNTKLISARRVNDAWQLETSQGQIVARWLINCAGLHGDTIEHLALGHKSFTIKPRKGQFVVFDKAASAFLRTIILPVPTERTKGIVLCRTIFGNLLVGPTAEETEERDVATVNQEMLDQLVARAVAMLPALATIPVTAIYAGLRPATEKKQYRMACHADRRYIAAAGIRSTGLTAALGIASTVYAQYAAAGNAHQPVANPVWPKLPNLAEDRARDFTVPGYGEIVCHCESVTRREIEQALQGPLPAQDLGGLKRRTRATMGRCQGFYCLANVSALADGYFTNPLATGHVNHG